MTAKQKQPLKRRVRCKCQEVFKSDHFLACAKCRKLELIASLRSFGAKHGRAPTARECGAGTDPLKPRIAPAYYTLCRAFGTFRAALAAAGLTTRGTGDRMAKRLGNPPAKRRPRRQIATEFRNDFVLAFPDMKRELERQCGYDGAIQVGEGRRTA